MRSPSDYSDLILETARQGLASGHAPTPWSFLISADGALELVADSDSPLDHLRRERGAALAFRLRSEGGEVAVDGCPGRAALPPAEGAKRRSFEFLPPHPYAAYECERALDRTGSGREIRPFD